MNNEPLLTLIMPIRGDGYGLREALISLENQVFKTFKLIIVDDGLEPQVLDLINSFNSIKIEIIKNREIQGVSGAFRTGVDVSNSTYTARVDSDDVYHPQKFQKQIDYLISNPKTDLIGSRIQPFYESKLYGVWNFPLQHEAVKVHSLFNSPMANMSVVGKTEVWKKYKCPDGYTWAEDYKTYSEMIYGGVVLENLPDVLVNYRLRNRTEEYIHTQEKSRRRIYCEYLPKFLNIPISFEELETHLNLTNQKTGFELESLRWIDKLVKASRKSNDIDTSILREHLLKLMYRKLKR